MSFVSPSAVHNSGQGWGLEFYDCVINNDLARLALLTDQHKIDLNARFTEVRQKVHLDLSPVHLVACQGYTGMLQYLHDSKCNIHQTTATLRRTPFHFAILRHKMACFHKLMAFGVNPDPRDTFGNSPCHYAAEDGACDILDVLLRQNIDINAQDITLKTPLMKATRNGKLEAVKRLVAARCSLNTRDKNSDTALHFAARHGGELLVDVLLRAGSDVSMQNQRGHTPLMEAVCYNNKAASAMLLRDGCDVNLREYKGGDTALHLAVRKNYNVIVDHLLATGHIKHVYNYQGELAVHVAVANQRLETIHIFLHYNYDLDVPIKLDYDGSGGKTAIRIALERGNFQLLRLFAKVGYHVSTRPAGGDDPGGEGGGGSSEGSRRSGGATRPGGGVSELLVAHINNMMLLQGQQEQQQLLASHPHSLQQRLAADSEHAALVQRFILEIKGVRCLKAICRRVIRKHVGYGVHQKAAQLSLPTTLREYILLNDML